MGCKCNAMFVLLLLVSVASALPAAHRHVDQIPLYYHYGGYPKIMTDISWGTPPQRAIPTVFDTGSVAFWTYGPHAIIVDGTDSYLPTPGPCSKKVRDIFDWEKSQTHSPVKDLEAEVRFAYGNYEKVIFAHQEINDTVSFLEAGFSPLTDVQVALANFTIYRMYDVNCSRSVDNFEQSILGMAPYGVGGGSRAAAQGPSLRSNLRVQGRLSSDILSVWMEKAPADVQGAYKGTALLGHPLPDGSYSGEKVDVALTPPQGPYVGYYISPPVVSVKGRNLERTSETVNSCLIDSGAGRDYLPFSADEAVQFVPGLIKEITYNNLPYLAWNGSCQSIPSDATIDFSFPGSQGGQPAIIKAPLRSYARGIYDGQYESCGLSLALDTSGKCLLGAPFFTAAALQFDDERKVVSMAQGGVA